MNRSSVRDRQATPTVAVPRACQNGQPSARITALEETRDALRIRAERAETDLDTARTENQRLAEQLTQERSTDADAAPASDPSPRPRTSRTKKTPATQSPR